MGQGWLIKNEKSCNYKSREHVSDEVPGVRRKESYMTRTTQLPSVICEAQSGTMVLRKVMYTWVHRACVTAESEAFESIILDNISTAHLLHTTVTTKFGFLFPAYDSY